jgi:phosphoenolpyruvate-protein kinase (PTS system EI component)
MSAPSLPLVKKVLRLLSYREAQALVKQALKLPTSAEIRAFFSGSEAGRRAAEA